MTELLCLFLESDMMTRPCRCLVLNQKLPEGQSELFTDLACVNARASGPP